MTENIHYFVCSTCNDGLQMTQIQAVEHLKSEHNATETKGNRQMTLHLDGRDWYQSNYQWTIGDVQLLEVCRNKRRYDDMMRMPDI